MAGNLTASGNASVGGNLTVTGSIIAGVKDFKIDHPLDPANKYLVHASIESSDVMNLYNSNAVLGEDGEAWARYSIRRLSFSQNLGCQGDGMEFSLGDCRRADGIVRKGCETAVGS